MRLGSLAFSLVVLGASLSVAKPALAEPRDETFVAGDEESDLDSSARSEDEEGSSDHRLQWDPRWPRVRWWEYALTGSLAIGSYVLVQSVLAGPEEPLLGGPLPGERAVRSVFRLRDRHDRQTLELVSDFAWYGVQYYPLVADILITTLIADQNPDVAWQLLVMYAQAKLISGFMVGMAQIFLPRPRPFYYECDDDPTYDSGCGKPTSFQSLFSGHTALSFSAAGFMCITHARLPLYGGGVADKAACGIMLGLAGGVATMRLMVDRHWISEVLLGTAVGLGAGYVMPWLLHFQDTSGPRDRMRSVVLPYGGSQEVGLQWLGMM